MQDGTVVCVTACACACVYVCVCVCVRGGVGVCVEQLAHLKRLSV